MKLSGESDKIDHAQAMQLLMAVVQHGSGRWVAKFVRFLSAAGQLDSTQVAQLLTAAAENGSVGACPNCGSCQHRSSSA
jgi:formate dehydrogenase maturation protein FdhE